MVCVTPNPVRGSTSISYSLKHAGPVNCMVYDATGKLVANPVNGLRAAGEQHATWNATGVRPGVYFVKLVAGGSVATTRLTVIE